MARRRVSEAEQARRDAEAAAVVAVKLPRELVWESGILFEVYREGSPFRQFAQAYSDWIPKRDRARTRWFSERGIAVNFTAADPRYTEALEGVEPLAVEEWTQWHNEGKFDEYR